MSCTGVEDITPRHAHIFLSLVCVPHLIALSHVHACVWLKLKTETWLGRVAHLRAFSKVVHSHSMFRRPLLDVSDPFSLFWSTPPPSTPNSLLMTGIRRPFPSSLPAPLRQEGGMLFGQLDGSPPFTKQAWKVCAR